MDGPLISALSDRLTAVAERFAFCRLGLYLHGSHAREEAGQQSDIDVLGLCAADGNAEESAEEACLDALSSQPWSARLDLKVVDAETFAADQWVDLRRSRWLAGFAWHETLPARTLDQAGRESLGVLGVYFEDEVFASRDDPHDLMKGVGRLCSVLAALVTGSVPHSASEAVQLLGTDRRLPRELADLRETLAALPDQATVSLGLSDRVQIAAADVAAVLRVHVERGLLGPICTAAGEQALTRYRSNDRVKGAASVVDRPDRTSVPGTVSG